MLPSKGCEKSKVGPACTLPIVFFFCRVSVEGRAKGGVLVNSVGELWIGHWLAAAGWEFFVRTPIFYSEHVAWFGFCDCIT